MNSTISKIQEITTLKGFEGSLGDIRIIKSIESVCETVNDSNGRHAGMTAKLISNTPDKVVIRWTGTLEDVTTRHMAMEMTINAAIGKIREE